MKKYTVIMKSGARHEVSSNDEPRVCYEESARQSHLTFGYKQFPFFVMSEIAGCFESPADDEDKTEPIV